MPSPTKEQLAILDAGQNRKESLMIKAYAGTGKTTTLDMLAKVLPVQPSMALAFNVSTKKNLEKRFPDHFQIKTMNGLGHVAWGKAIGKRCEVDDRKLGKLVTEGCKAAGFQSSQDQWNSIRQLVSSAMMQGLIPKEFQNYKGLIPDEEAVWRDIADENWIEVNPLIIIDIARWVLKENIKLSFNGVLSFDDQIYMSALFGGVFPRFPLVMVDEAQDLSPLNHIQVKRAAAGRLIVVGDQKQSIYAFRGADHESIAKLRALRSDWIDLPLATTFRCPKVVVGRQQDHAPGFVAWETNQEGQFENLLSRADPRWTWGTIKELSKTQEIAVLCRNNAPLLSMAFKLIRSGIGCTMMGRDIGKGLIVLSRKILPLDDIPAVQCVTLIRQWKEGEISLAVANEKEGKIAGIEDRAECLIAVIESGRAKDSKDLREKLERIFSNDHGQVVLSTGHRAKGLEWDTVVHIDPWRIPSKFAMRANADGQPAQLQQELNLKYVIETRTKQTLILANVEDFSNGED